MSGYAGPKFVRVRSPKNLLSVSVSAHVRSRVRSSLTLGCSLSIVPMAANTLIIEFQQWYRDILKVWKNVSRLSKNAPKQLSIRRSVKDEIKNNEKVAMAHFKISNKKITSLDIWCQFGLIWNGAYIARVFEKNKSFNQTFLIKKISFLVHCKECLPKWQLFQTKMAVIWK